MKKKIFFQKNHFIGILFIKKGHSKVNPLSHRPPPSDRQPDARRAAAAPRPT